MHKRQTLVVDWAHSIAGDPLQGLMLNASLSVCYPYFLSYEFSDGI